VRTKAAGVEVHFPKPIHLDELVDARTVAVACGGDTGADEMTSDFAARRGVGNGTDVQAAGPKMSLSRRSVLLALPIAMGAAWAQPAPSATPKRVALLFGGSSQEARESLTELTSTLASLGWKPGSTVIVEGSFADNDVDRLPALADELVRRKVDVIVTGGAITTLAAARATSTIPIVFTSLHYPIEHGLVQSYSRPGRNITGPALYPGVDLLVKPLDYLREIAPKAKRLAFIYPRDLIELPTLAGTGYDLQPIVVPAAKRLGFEPRFHLTSPSDDLDALFRTIAADGAEVLMGGTLAPARMIEFAARQRWPAMYPMRLFVEAGGLISYGPLEAEMRQSRQYAARYVDRLLRGSNAAELPIDRPSRYELAINVGAAKAMGLVLAQSLLLRADTLIGT
jgi:putative ABC transport system substrate-binding protein